MDCFSNWGRSKNLKIKSEPSTNSKARIFPSRCVAAASHEPYTITRINKKRQSARVINCCHLWRLHVTRIQKFRSSVSPHTLYICNIHRQGQLPRRRRSKSSHRQREHCLDQPSASSSLLPTVLVQFLSLRFCHIWKAPCKTWQSAIFVLHFYSCIASWSEGGAKKWGEKASWPELWKTHCTTVIKHGLHYFATH